MTTCIFLFTYLFTATRYIQKLHHHDKMYNRSEDLHVAQIKH